jgi:hypothetical protein
LSNPDQQPIETEAAEPDARPVPVPVLYTFTCGGAKVPCRLTYTFDGTPLPKLPRPNNTGNE